MGAPLTRHKLGSTVRRTSWRVVSANLSVITIVATFADAVIDKRTAEHVFVFSEPENVIQRVQCNWSLVYGHAVVGCV